MVKILIDYMKGTKISGQFYGKFIHSVDDGEGENWNCNGCEFFALQIGTKKPPIEGA